LKKAQLYLTIKEAYPRIASFCAYQERTQNEVRTRLLDYGITGDEAEEVIVMLMQDNYLNESRFAKTYAGGKSRIKKWGKNKIKQALKQKGISDNCIKIAIQEIDPNEYLQNMIHLAEKKVAEVKETNPLKKKQKVLNYLLTKGYENDLVWEVINNLEFKI
jgi:regulatory protein